MAGSLAVTKAQLARRLAPFGIRPTIVHRCPSPKFGIDAMRLIFSDNQAKVPRHAQSDFQHVAIHHSHPRRPQRDRLGECRLATTVDDPQKGTAASETPASRSIVLDSPDEDLETMENGTRRRTTRYCGELAAAAIQAVLEEAVPEEKTGTAEGLCRAPETGSDHGGG